MDNKWTFAIYHLYRIYEYFANIGLVILLKEMVIINILKKLHTVIRICASVREVKQSLYSPRGFQEVKVPRFRDNGKGWW